MRKTHKKFIKQFKKYLKSAPDLRITQALYNVGVTLGVKKGSDTKPEYYLIDNYNETDEVILTRMKKNIKDGKKQEKRQQTQTETSTGDINKKEQVS